MMTVLLMQDLETAEHWHYKRIVVVLSGTHKAYCLLLHIYSIYLHFFTPPLSPPLSSLTYVFPSFLSLFFPDDCVPCSVVVPSSHLGQIVKNDVCMLKILKSNADTCGLKCLKYWGSFCCWCLPYQKC